MKSIVTFLLVFQLVVAVILIRALPAHADSFGFYNITNTADVNVAGQFIVDVTPYDSNVLFTFHNNGPNASFIGAVYFDDGNLEGIDSIINISPGVAFTQDNEDTVKPAELPGGNNIDFVMQKFLVPLTFFKSFSISALRFWFIEKGPINSLIGI